jgi:hypothetical protein
MKTKDGLRAMGVYGELLFRPLWATGIARDSDSSS